MNDSEELLVTLCFESSVSFYYSHLGFLRKILMLMQSCRYRKFQGKNEDKNLFLGPILRIVGSDSIEFLKPVTIQLPVYFQEEQEGISDPSICRVRVLFLRTDGERKQWIEITGDLANPASFDGTFVSFQVERFSGYGNKSSITYYTLCESNGHSAV